MTKSLDNYYINNPVFVKYKTRFDWHKRKKESFLKSVVMNERIIEIPFAIKSISSLSTDKKVLDLGCTESPLSLYVASLGYDVTGFDFRKYPYEHPCLKCVQGDILELPFSDNSFDAVLSVSTIEHVGIGFYDDPLLVQKADLKAIEQVARVLKKGGVFVLTVPFGISSINDFQRVYDEESLKKIISQFMIEECRYYKDTDSQNSLCNYWSEVDKQTASQVSSLDRANCVCVIKAIKE